MCIWEFTPGHGAGRAQKCDQVKNWMKAGFMG